MVAVNELKWAAVVVEEFGCVLPLVDFDTYYAIVHLAAVDIQLLLLLFIQNKFI